MVQSTVHVHTPAREEQNRTTQLSISQSTDEHISQRSNLHVKEVQEEHKPPPGQLTLSLLLISFILISLFFFNIWLLTYVSR